jgi:hypothetical protein
MRGTTIDQFENEPARLFSASDAMVLTLSSRLSYLVGCSDQQFRYLAERSNHPLLQFIDLHVYHSSMIYDGAALLLVCGPQQNTNKVVPRVQLLWQLPSMLCGNSWPYRINNTVAAVVVGGSGDTAHRLKEGSTKQTTYKTSTNTTIEMSIEMARQWCGTLRWYNHFDGHIYQPNPCPIFNDILISNAGSDLVIVRRLIDGADIVLALPTSTTTTINSTTPTSAGSYVDMKWSDGQEQYNGFHILMNSLGTELVLMDHQKFHVFDTQDILTAIVTTSLSLNVAIERRAMYASQLYGRVTATRVIELKDWPSELELRPLNGCNHFIRLINNNSELNICSFVNGKVELTRSGVETVAEAPVRSVSLASSSCDTKRTNNNDTTHMVVTDNHVGGVFKVHLYSLSSTPSSSSSSSLVSIEEHGTLSATAAGWHWMGDDIGAIINTTTGAMTVYRVTLPHHDASSSLTTTGKGRGPSDVIEEEGDSRSDSWNNKKKMMPKRYGFEKIWEGPPNKKELYQAMTVPSQYNNDATDAIIEWVTCSLMDASVG